MQKYPIFSVSPKSPSIILEDNRKHLREIYEIWKIGEHVMEQLLAAFDLYSYMPCTTKCIFRHVFTTEEWVVHFDNWVR